MARCCLILTELWWQSGHFQRPASTSVGYVLPLLLKAGHWTLSSFLILAGGEERRGDCETCNKIVYNVLKQLWNRGGYQIISRAATALRNELEEISISTLLTLELLRFVADL